MRITAYTYPWDIARLGVEETFRQMADDGIGAIDLAASYHPIDALSPRSGVHYFSNARGAVYFPARASRYSLIKPLVHSPEISAAWSKAANVAATLGLGLNAWTITLFQPWIRDTHPECARVLPTGDKSGSDVCAANEHVRTYVASLAEDAVDQFGVGIVRLEGPMPQHFDLDWLRPRVLVDVPPLARTLLNLCFCRSCVENAKSAGLDAERLRCVIMENVGAEIAGGDEAASAERGARLSEDAELRAFAANHVKSAVDLIKAVRARVGGRARLSNNVATPYGALLGQAAEDELLTGFIEALDQIAMHPANSRGNARIAGILEQRNTAREISMIFARLQPPSAADSAQMQQDLREAGERGADEVTLYAHGLQRPRDVEAFVSAVRQAFPV